MTDRDARPLSLSEAAELTPSERLELACELFDDALEMLRLRVEREHPDWDEDAVERELERWLLDRPGAEFGDIAGPHLRVRIL